MPAESRSSPALPPPGRDDGPSSPISCVLLLKSPREIDVPALLNALAKRLSPNGLSFEPVHGARGLTFCGLRLHIRITLCAQPYVGPSVRRALGSGLGGHIGEDWQASVTRHRAAITVNVHAGRAGAELAPELTPDRGDLRELDDLMLATAHVAAAHLTRAHAEEAEAVLWEPSAQLFSPARFLAMADMIYPLPLFLHPAPRAEAGTCGGDPFLSLDFYGAERLMGHGLRFDAAPAPLDWLAQRAFALIAYLRATGERLQPGDSFGLQDGERIEVDRCAAGKMVLRLTERAGRPVRGAA